MADPDPRELANQGLLAAIAGFGQPGTGGTTITQIGHQAALLSEIDRLQAQGADNIRVRHVPGPDGAPSGKSVIQELTVPNINGIPIRGAEPTWETISTFDTSDLDLDGLDAELQERGLQLEERSLDISAKNAETQRRAQEETARANQASEAAAARARALSASTAAMNAYLQGTQLADARRLNAFQEARALLPNLVPAGEKFFGGQAPGGLLDQFSQKFLGKSFEGAKIVPVSFRPGELARPPTSGEIGSQIVAGVGDIRSKG